MTDSPIGDSKPGSLCTHLLERWSEGVGVYSPA